MCVCVWSASQSGRFTSGKELQYPVNWKMLGPREYVWALYCIENLLFLPVFEPRTVLPVESRYTKYGVSATANSRKKMIVGLRNVLSMYVLYHAASQSLMCSVYVFTVCVQCMSIALPSFGILLSDVTKRYYLKAATRAWK